MTETERAGGEEPGGPSHPGSVVLDIGGTTGALVVHTPEAFAGAEIHVYGVSTGTASTHAVVRERQLPAGSRFAAVFPGLPEGVYQLPELAGTDRADVRVTGGQVTEIRLAAAAVPGTQHQHQHAHVSTLAAAP